MDMPRCVECGLVHPPTRAGECPVAKDRKVEEEIKANLQADVANGVLNIKDDLVKKFKDNEDSKLCMTFLNKIRNFINNTPL